ncbi:hypothetical protein [Myxococcus qinghaiensis]|uniref:hypothetical protein n=1 Tax=Myxococcus qinghaiensis TaxID=2906758 RepID=UPI0020A786E9|nr:hypothetical protein [Myxococcus qinghaiensis]MCP3161808.1 hypothetical protein [Myxococcus qinghaiensis]
MAGNRQEARKRSVDNLQRLYTVAISLAVTESLRRVITDPSGMVARPETQQVLMFLCLISTVVPFYHGANRYLDATYVTGERTAKDAALMIDFLFLFIEGLAFFGLALLINRPEPFFTTLAALLIFDAIWIGVTNLTAKSAADKMLDYRSWATINILAAFLIAMLTWSNVIDPLFWKATAARDVILTLIVILRTIYDYHKVWNFYFPEQETGNPPDLALIPAAPITTTDKPG